VCHSIVRISEIEGVFSRLGGISGCKFIKTWISTKNYCDISAGGIASVRPGSGWSIASSIYGAMEALKKRCS
jgi:hypothetical protein